MNMTLHEFLNKNRFAVSVLTHSVVIVLGYSLAFLTRFSPEIFQTPAYVSVFLLTVGPLLFLRLCSYMYFGLFKGLMRYTGTKDLINIIKGAMTGTLLFAAFSLFTVLGFSRSVIVIDMAYNILLIGGLRLAVRMFKEETGRRAPEGGTSVSKKILIVGAGNAGEMILREINNNHRLSYEPKGFVDDDRGKRGRTIHGVKVLGNTRDIGKIAIRCGIEEVFIAIPSAGSKVIHRIVRTCKRANIKFKTLPHVGDLIEGRAALSQIRDVAIEDLLGREAANIDMSFIGKELSGKVMLVTGAAGSIGSELVRQIARFKPSKVIMFERAESDLYRIELEAVEKFNSVEFVPFVGDIRDEERVRECVEAYRPGYIFHAAAYKHVPMMEMNPREAVKNNVFGTRVLLDIACEYDVEKFVLISTDKAVHPTNIMGATKRVTELLMLAKASDRPRATNFVAVRFGNVLGSNGSVVPLFKKQIADGGPVTITHPDVTRYFMTIPEAAQLVIQAGAMGSGGEIFLLEMGAPVKIKDLAENLIRLSGLVPEKDIPIVYCGLRPGEKLFEELLIDGEGVQKTHHNKIYVLKSKSINGRALNAHLKRLSDLCNAGSQDEVRQVLKELVPEYIYNRTVERRPGVDGKGRFEAVHL